MFHVVIALFSTARKLIDLHQSLKAGQPVFFGCDVGQFSEGGSGVMDTELFEYEVGNHYFSAVSPIVIIYDPWRTPLTFRFHFRKPTACARMSPQ